MGSFTFAHESNSNQISDQEAAEGKNKKNIRVKDLASNAQKACIQATSHPACQPGVIQPFGVTIDASTTQHNF